MNTINATQLLDQLEKMRSLAQQESALRPPATQPESADFSALIKNQIEQVNHAQKTGSEMAKAFELGEPGVDLAQVMISMQKASIQFQALTEVRNKLLGAYQEVMSMQV